MPTIDCRNAKPPGRLSIALGANSIATCDCGSVTFNLMIKMDVVSQVLVAIKCVVCDEEATVPLDPVIEPARKFQS